MLKNNIIEIYDAIVAMATQALEDIHDMNIYEGTAVTGRERITDRIACNAGKNGKSANSVSLVQIVGIQEIHLIREAIHFFTYAGIPTARTNNHIVIAKHDDIAPGPGITCCVKFPHRLARPNDSGNVPGAYIQRQGF